MAANQIRWNETTTEDFTELARRLKQTSSNWQADSGVDLGAAQAFGWETLSDNSTATNGIVIWVNELPAILLRLESDLFNSNCLEFPQARLHWLLNADLNWTSEIIRESSKALKAILRQSHWKLIAGRLLENSSPAKEIFQLAGFRLVIGNAWFFRYHNFPLPPRQIPSAFEFELRDLKEDPFCESELEEMLAIARESLIPDRFSLDRRIAPELVERRFKKVITNGLTGKIATHVAVARTRTQIQTFVFFAATEVLTDQNRFVAGSWLTAITRSSNDIKGLSCNLIAESIHLFSTRNADWTATCALSNFRSMGGLYKLLFRLGAISYDFHWWSEE